MTSARWPALIAAALFCAARAAADGYAWPQRPCDPSQQKDQVSMLYCGLPDGADQSAVKGRSTAQAFKADWDGKTGDPATIFDTYLQNAPDSLKKSIDARFGSHLKVTTSDLENKGVIQNAETATSGKTAQDQLYSKQNTSATPPVSAGDKKVAEANKIVGDEKADTGSGSGKKLDQPVPGAYPDAGGDGKSKPFKLNGTQKQGLVSGFWGALLFGMLMGPAGLILGGAIAGAAGYAMAKQGSDDDGGDKKKSGGHHEGGEHHEERHDSLSSHVKGPGSFGGWH